MCHSLGGLVVKKASQFKMFTCMFLMACMQALILAQESHDAAGIRKATIAVAFMGTPHRGSQLASYADIALTCIKAAGVRANTGNLQQLKLDSDNLEEIGSQFGSLLQLERIKVLTFYELKPTRIAGITEAVVRLKHSCHSMVGANLKV